MLVVVLSIPSYSKCMKQSNIFFSSQSIIIFKEFVYQLQAV